MNAKAPNKISFFIMGKSSEIKQMIRNIAAFNEGLSLFEAEVSAVQDTTISIKYQGLEHENVRLVAGFSASSSVLIQKPKVGTLVLVADLSRGKFRDLVVLLQEETEEIVINGGQLGGLIKIEELKKNLGTMSKRIDGIIDAIKNAVPVAQDGGAALQASIVAALPTGKEDFSDIEDEKVRH